MDDSGDLNFAALIQSVDRLRLAIEANTRARGSWRIAMRTGLVAAIGGLLGTTILLAVLVRLLSPLEQISSLKPAIQGLTDRIERKR